MGEIGPQTERRVSQVTQASVSSFRHTLCLAAQDWLPRFSFIFFLWMIFLGGEISGILIEEVLWGKATLNLAQDSLIASFGPLC